MSIFGCKSRNPADEDNLPVLFMGLFFNKFVMYPAGNPNRKPGFRIPGLT